MVRRGYLVPLVLLLAAADVPAPYDWSTADLSYIGGDAQFRASRALCAAVITAEPPAADRPTRAEQAALKECDSEALYYGIGTPADPAKARKCAFVEAGGEQYGGPSQPYFGTGMLAIIYANGRGAKQNYDVALHMTCGLDNAASETSARIERLATLRSAHVVRPAFDTCLDTSSGELAGQCVAHDARLNEQARARRISVAAATWSPAQRSAFARLSKSADAYASTLHEMDCFRGTLQSACTINGADKFMADFTTRIIGLGKGNSTRIEAKAMANRRRQEQANRADGLPGDGLPKEEYDANAVAIVTHRAVFERDLVAFARLTFPAISSHRIRRIFSDL